MFLAINQSSGGCCKCDRSPLALSLAPDLMWIRSRMFGARIPAWLV